MSPLTDRDFENLKWKSWLIEAEGDSLRFFPTGESPGGAQANMLRVDGYVGYFYPHDDFLLVATARCLLRFDADASLVWQSKMLGVDGVIVTEIRGDLILGEGEWDPPGGWKPFAVRMRIG